MSTVRNKFPNARVVGCLFHFVQALSRNLKELGRGPTQIEIAMSPNVLDVLTVIPKSEMRSKSMPHAKRVIGSFRLRTPRQELIEIHYKLGKDHYTGLTSE